MLLASQKKKKKKKCGRFCFKKIYTGTRYFDLFSLVSNATLSSAAKITASIGTRISKFC